MTLKLFDAFLKMNNSFTIDIDYTQKKIVAFYNCDKLIGTNITYNEFVDCINLDENSKNKLLRFLDNLTVDSKPFNIDANFKYANGEPFPTKINGIKYEENHVLIVIKGYDEVAVDDNVDNLTKTYSKDLVVSQIKKSISENKPFIMLLLDIDKLREINLEYGKNNGDMILVRISAKLKEVISSGDFIGRVGGDEFVVIIHMDNDYNNIRSKILEVKQAIEKLDIGSKNDIIIKSTIASVAYPFDGTSYETLIKKAKVALTRGKNKGGNCFIIYDVNKCGLPTANIKANFEFDKVESKFTNYNVITSVYELLNRDKSIEYNIPDALSIVGNYFQLDRIVIVEYDIDSNAPGTIRCWTNTRCDDYKLTNLDNQKEAIYRMFIDSMDNEGKFKFNQVEANKTSAIYPILNSGHTQSTLCYELKTEGKSYGVISFDMCLSNRFWTQDEMSSLMVIAKVFSILYSKEHTKRVHNKEIYYDKLTGIYNVIRFRDVVTDLIYNNHSLKYTIVNMKLNGYKNVYNKFGIVKAGQAITAVSDALVVLEEFKQYKNIFFCRSNEDEFVIFLPFVESDLIVEYVTLLKATIKHVFSSNFGLKLLIGIYQNQGVDTYETAIDKSRLARDDFKAIAEPYLFFTGDLYEKELFKTNLELHMKTAAKNGEFLLYLQPKIDTLTGKAIGAEALTRWHYKFSEILMPFAFIELFEHNGFINTLDYIVFENVCKFLKYNADNGLDNVKISVNVSRYQIDYDEYIERINDIRDKYDVPASLIEVEITEGMYVKNIENISTFIDKLHSFGYTVSMDDFGSGYSNLASLADLDFDLIKLDKHFCSNQNDEKENIILRFVMELSKNLNIDVLCEGVETEEYKDYLKSLGCTKVQGYLYDKPMPNVSFREKYLMKKD